MASKTKYFGTDGIRGLAGEGKLSKSRIAHLGLALGEFVSAQKSGGLVVIGRDTRRSGHWIEDLLVTGLTAHGVNVKLLGVLPTAAASYLTVVSGGDLGIMITASHNPYHDNGVKFFGPDGRKIGQKAQSDLEALMDQDLDFPVHVTTGKIRRNEQMKFDYIDKIISTLESKPALENLSVVLDCANGAAFETGPELLRRLKLKSLHVIGQQPNGMNINAGCGSTHPEKLSAAVQAHKADIGIALDGDADRLIMCDETGRVVDGDQIMGALALNWKSKGHLIGGGLVATVMSNLGLERLMIQSKLELIRTKVGDRHVAAAMESGGYNLGGEQSGHLLMPDYLPTGDGMLAALQVLSVLGQSAAPASEALNLFKPVPQILVNVRYDGPTPLDNPIVKKAIKDASEEFGDNGRVLIRASGTEPVIRVMTEGDDEAQVKSVAENLADIIKAHS